jgi:hypothetical protein
LGVNTAVIGENLLSRLRNIAINDENRREWSGRLIGGLEADGATHGSLKPATQQ